jgi:hypothetical protein
MHSYSDVLIMLSYAPHCDDIAQGALAQLELAAAAARLAEHAAWTCLVGELVALGATAVAIGSAVQS